MKLTIEERALAACRELVACRTEVERLSTIIGENLSACHSAWMAVQEKNSHPSWSYDPNGYEAHLKAAYTAEVYEPESQYESGDIVYKSEQEIVDLLSVCPYCLVAHHTIQERKAARRKLSSARRAITVIGKTK